VTSKEKIICQLCGSEVEPKAIEKHYVVPKEITEQARMRRAKIVRLCPKCGAELKSWYSARIADTVYDTQIKRFREKLPLEMVREYEGAYNRFARFKKGQQLKV
jgi:NMD protein affecting ribosome stability and mRNA decay